MNTKGPKFEDFPDKLQEKVMRQVVENVARRPVKVRLPFYFKKKGGVNK